jgi:thiamine biosynthesis lipoprotein
MKFFLLFVLSLITLHGDIVRQQVVMGTFCTITLEDNQTDAITEGFKRLKIVEKVLSSYDKAARLSQLNHKKKVAYHPMLADILKRSISYHQSTNGYFDITIGAITKKLYRFGESNASIPTSKQLKSAKLSMDKIHINRDFISLEDNITLDLGGIGKGYGVDILAKEYRQKGLEYGVIALSGDIGCLHQCKISIQDPFDESRVYASFVAKINNLSISTSGTYRHYIKRQKNNHLINPKTKRQTNDFVSVTVVAQANNTLCDAYATAIATMPKERALEFITKQKDMSFMLIDSRGRVTTHNLDRFLKKLE